MFRAGRRTAEAGVGQTIGFCGLPPDRCIHSVEELEELTRHVEGNPVRGGRRKAEDE